MFDVLWIVQPIDRAGCGQRACVWKPILVVCCALKLQEEAKLLCELSLQNLEEKLVVCVVGVLIFGSQSLCAVCNKLL